MNTRQKLQIVVSAIIFLMFISGMIAVTFFLTALFYHSIGYQPPAFLVQVINSLIGLFLGWLMLVGFFVIPGVRRNRMGVFQPIIEALERIARGDFTVRLDHPIRNNALISELASSVNHMALELNQMEQMRQAFISDVSHEIQSPLTSIRGFAQALHSAQLSATDRDHYLSIIEAESTRLSNLTDNLLKLASLESEQPPFQPRSYRLDKQIRRLILLCEPQWMSKAIDMDVSLEEITLTADEDLLSQVWLNLIHNSIKFTPNGGSVRVAFCRQGNTVLFTIADTGIGISEEDQDHIFERFYKADKSRERTHEGSGLGLAITQKIVEMHHGAIRVASETGVGTTFTISLPVEQVGNDAEKARVSA